MPHRVGVAHREGEDERGRVLVPAIDVGPLRREHLDHVVVAGDNGRPQRRNPVIGDGVDLCAVLHQDSRDVGVSFGRCPVERRPSVRLGGIDVSPGRHQQLDDGKVALG